MPKITLEEAYEDYRIWRTAERDQAAGLSYSIAGRSLTRIPLSEILERVKYYGDIIDKLEGTKKKSRTRIITPMDS